MTARYSLADVAALVGEPTRAAMLLALLDGGAMKATSLAREARLSPSATSLHLAKLTRGGLLSVRQEGRHRYYRLANAEVAHALEALGAIATKAMPARSAVPAHAALRGARTCYDHLAGALSVGLAEMLVRERLLRLVADRAYEVTREGERWFEKVMHIEIGALSLGRRPLALRCLDWTERRPHVAGALGAAVLECLFENRWVARVPATRALRVTLRGHAAFADLGFSTAEFAQNP